MKNPTSTSLAVVYHPGRTLSEKLEEMSMGVKEFAVRTTKPEKTIIAVMKGSSSITPEMAVAFESVTMIPAHFWMNKQRAYDEFLARKKREQEIVLSTAWMKKFPVKEMIERGMIAACTSVEETLESIFSFFSVSSEKAWEDYYLNQELKVAFRISLANSKNPYSMSVWLRQGELQAKSKNIDIQFSKEEVRSKLKDMKSLMKEAPEDFFIKLQDICASCGICLLYTPCLSKAPISGATRWIGDTPIIQVSNRYQSYDKLWFTFFHEVGHILLHGKKSIFLEDAGYFDIEEETKEKEADVFASNIVFPKIQETAFVAQKNFTNDAIIRAANLYGTHPSIIVGRLQHNKTIAYWQGKELIKKVSL